MSRHRLVKGLKISWAAFWSVVAVLLIVLWVRSISSFDEIYPVVSAQGKFYFKPDVTLSPSNDRPGSIEYYESFGVLLGTYKVRNVQIARRPGASPVIPFWPLILEALLIAVLPWIHWRFSLRTLLIAMTLLAMVLGLIVWSYR